MNATTHNAGAWIPSWARRAGERLALVDDDRRLDWATLEDRTARLAGYLRDAGVGPGDRIAILLANRSPYLEAVFACSRVGAVCLPMNTRLSPREIAFLLDDCQPAGLILEADLSDLAERAFAVSSHAPRLRLTVGGVDDAYEAALQNARPHVDVLAVSPDHPMILMYTSGTTGHPKGALLPHRKALFNSLNAQLVFGIRPCDRILVASPLFHSLGLQIISIPVVYAGGCLFLQERFDPEAVWRTVEEEEIVYFGSVPTVYQRLAEVLEARRESNPVRPEQLRFCFTAGAAVSVDLVHTFERFGLVLKQGYGQTETSMLCCLEESDAVRKAGSVGRPLFHLELRVVGLKEIEGPAEGWRDVAEGETGEIVVRGPITMLGYWQRAEANLETLREDGWLRTNDLATVDEEGFVTLAGRARDMYISGGENVYPAEVEAVLSEHPAIREVAVVGVPHERWGETGRAHLVLEKGQQLEADALLEWAAERLAKFKLPQHVLFEEDLPRTASGKVQKHRLTG